MSLKRGSGTLKVSSMKTTFCALPRARIESNSFSNVSSLASVKLSGSRGIVAEGTVEGATASRASLNRAAQIFLWKVQPVDVVLVQRIVFE